jgi:hypothetical protein
MEVINFVGLLMTLCFMAIRAVGEWEFVYDLSAVSSKLTDLLTVCSHLQLISSVFHHGAVYFRGM